MHIIVEILSIKHEFKKKKKDPFCFAGKHLKQILSNIRGDKRTNISTGLS